MTQKQINEIKSRCEVATPEPWAYEIFEDGTGNIGIVADSDGNLLEGSVTLQDESLSAIKLIACDVDADNAEFFVHAHEDISALLEYISELETRLEKAIAEAEKR